MTLINGRWVWSPEHKALARVTNAETNAGTTLNDEPVELDPNLCEEPSADMLAEAAVTQPEEESNLVEEAAGNADLTEN